MKKVKRESVCLCVCVWVSEWDGEKLIEKEGTRKKQEEGDVIGNGED